MKKLAVRRQRPCTAMVGRFIPLPRRRIQVDARLLGKPSPKLIDTLAWVNGVVPDAGRKFMDFYREGPYGVWLVWMELLVCGVVPAFLLAIPKLTLFLMVKRVGSSRPLPFCSFR